MTIAIPDTTEIVKDGALTPAGILFLQDLVTSLNTTTDAAFTDEQRADLAAINTSLISTAGKVDDPFSAYLDETGVNRSVWYAALIKVALGTATLAEVNSYIQFMMFSIQTNYDNSVAIVNRLAEIESALGAN